MIWTVGRRNFLDSAAPLPSRLVCLRSLSGLEDTCGASGPPALALARPTVLALRFRLRPAAEPTRDPQRLIGPLGRPRAVVLRHRLEPARRVGPEGRLLVHGHRHVLLRVLLLRRAL